MSSPASEMVRLADYQPPSHAIPQVELNFDIWEDKTEVRARLFVVPQETAGTNAPLELDGEDLELVEVSLAGQPLKAGEYSLNDAKLVILNPPNGPFTLETRVKIDPANNTKLMGLYRSNGIWCTQCEAEGFRRITFFPDRPDVLSRYKVRIEADEKDAPVLLSNGNLVEEGSLAHGRHYAVWADPFPKPSYLFAVVAGDLGSIHDSFTTMSGREVKLGIYVEKGKEPRAEYAMGALKRSMTWDEERFGREYDLEVFNIVAVSDFNIGAMENKGLNIFNDKLVLADADLATDAEYLNIERVIAHEYFHNWTGNRITCRDWFQLSLKEGLTVFRDQEFSSDTHSRAVKRMDDVQMLYRAQFPEDAGPLAHPVRPDAYEEIDNFYTATVYNKGAEVVRMLANLMGPEMFRKGTDLYFARHDGEATTVEAWLKVFEDVSGRDLTQFKRWYEQAGTPLVSFADEYDAESRTYALTITQNTPATPGQKSKQPQVLPIKFGLVGPNGQDMQWSGVEGGEVNGDTIVVSENETRLEFSGVAHKPVLSVFREFSAPVRIDEPLHLEDRLFLARQDSDAFTRWRMLREAQFTLLKDELAGSNTEPSFKDEQIAALAEAFEGILGNADLDDAFKARAIEVPNETAIAHEIGQNVDPDRIAKVRRALVMHIADRIGPQLLSIFEAASDAAHPYAVTSASMGARALKNAALRLMAGMSRPDADRVGRQFHNADNMTDRLAALSVAVENRLENADALLAAFKTNNTNEPFSYDKWLGLVAADPRPQSLERVKAIWHDPDFPKTNPNRVRSLLASFAAGNPVNFARADGAGFRFHIDACKEMDTINPHMAAGLLQGIRMFRNYEPTRRAQAEAALKALAENQGLSRGTRDILGRLLAS